MKHKVLVSLHCLEPQFASLSLKFRCPTPPHTPVSSLITPPPSPPLLPPSPQVLQSKPENLVDTFLLLMPAHAQGAQDFVHVCEMKVREGGAAWVGGTGTRLDLVLGHHLGILTSCTANMYVPGPDVLPLTSLTLPFSPSPPAGPKPYILSAPLSGSDPQAAVGPDGSLPAPRGRG